MTTLSTQLGFEAESTYGTPVTVDRFTEYDTEALKAVPGRVESQAFRASGLGLRSTRFLPTDLGAAGALKLPVMSKGMGLLFKHMLGSIATVGPTDSTYTHTATVADLLGLSLTVQLNKPLHPSGTAQPFTYQGCKVVSWDLECGPQGLLTLTLTLDSQHEDTVIALAAASYPGNTKLFGWPGSVATIAGTPVAVTQWKVSGNNNLDVGRFYQQGSTLKKEPVRQAQPSVTWSMTCDFSDLTQYARVRNLVASGTMAAVVVTVTGQTLIGASTYPAVAITVPNARFDGDTPMIGGPNPLMLNLQGVGTYDGTNSIVSVAYTTADSAP